MSPAGEVTLRFKTFYHTQWGEALVLCGPGPMLGNLDVERGHKLECSHVGSTLVWQTSLRVAHPADLLYKYAVVDARLNVVKWESGSHTLHLPADLVNDAIVTVTDVWEDDSHPAHLFARSAFRKAILGDHQIPRLAAEGPRPSICEGHALVKFQVRDWQLKEGQQVCVTGGAPGLGSWQLPQSLSLRLTAPSCWEVEVSIPHTSFPLTYKYVIRGADGTLLLEAGENRMMPAPKEGPLPLLVVRNDSFFRHERRWRGAGVAVPVFSLRTEASVGCGDFADLCPLLDFCRNTGLSVVQLLPVNDTSVKGDWRDSYPYSSLCVFALHPLYLCLDRLPGADASAIQEEVAEARRRLNLPDMDYEQTLAAKLAIARKLFDAAFPQLLSDPAFLEFCAHHEEWLKPYSMFCYFQSFFGTADHTQWGRYSAYDPRATAKFWRPDSESARDMWFCSYLQYHLHCQLSAASAYARERHVVLKGDLPIGVDKCSVDTWLYPNLFHMGTGTGSPPDWFNQDGQNWGFPTYNWEEMAKDDYSWWRRRLAQMARYFQAFFRVDHIIGFFRIWEIPGDCWSGMMGHFRPCIPIARAELEAKGIWDFHRLEEPYVTLALLTAELGDVLAAEAASAFFEPSYGDRLRFREEYASEVVLRTLTVPEGMSGLAVSAWPRIHETLLLMRRNVLLLRDPEDPQKLYPRFDLTKTTSFAALDNVAWAEELAWQHDDYFYRRQEELWRAQGHRTLPALLSSSDMLMCGEDLGFTPACVRPIMEELGILALRIQRMPSGQEEFGDPADYPYMCVASPSSHDTTTTRAWYEEDAPRRQRYYAQVLGGEGPAPASCTPEIMRAIAQQHVDSPAVLAIFPIQDIIALETWDRVRPASEETINAPSNPEHYWRYRMHLTLRELDCPRLQATVQGLLLSSGRCLAGDLPRLMVEE
ncbi:DPE2 [Auxenochlorella protothecoides x Auxenochlorella symbiontica]